VVNQDGIPDELCTESAHAQFQRFIVELNNAIFSAQFCRALVLSSGRVVNQDGIPDELCTEAAHAQFQRLIAEHFRDGQGMKKVEIICSILFFS
jgi:histidinol phosphatase-like enzyme